jgi:hypothetical protein
VAWCQISCQTSLDLAKQQSYRRERDSSGT